MTTSSEPIIVGGRYELLEPLGSGSQGETFLARDPDGEVVVVKKFTLAAMAGWKSLELFQREIETLRSLSHPQIPTFIDAVEDDDAHYLVQQYIEGSDLSELIAQRPFSEAELKAVARDVLGVLGYMHGLAPPVVHRDLKPSNIIRRPDGTHVVVDFGGVQNIVAKDTGGSTVIGTTGYMPSEQLIGRAVPQSDIYALGATLAHLATGKHPTQLPTKRLVLEWRPHADLGGAFANTIDEMLSPAPEDRPASAELLRNRLESRRRPTGAMVPATSRQLTATPGGTFDLSQRVRRSDDTLIIDLSPPLGSAGMLLLFILTAAGLLLALLTSGLLLVVLLVAGGLVVTVVGFSDAFDVSERLTLHRDGSFEHRWSDGSERRRTCGQLVGAPTVGQNCLQIVSQSGTVPAGTGLSSRQLESTATEVDRWLNERTNVRALTSD